MQVIITCAGEGTRLRPLTDNCPKPLLGVNGKPLIEYMLDWLDQFNCEKIVITTHYKKHKFDSWHDQLKKALYPKVQLFQLDCLIGIAQQVKQICKEGIITDENFIVIHGDLFIQGMVLGTYFSFHKFRSALATICVHRGISNSIVKFLYTENNKIYDFQERPEKAEDGFVNSGIYFFNRDILNYISDSDQDFPKDVFPKLIGKWFHALEFSGNRVAVDSIARLESVRNLLK